MIPLSSTAVRQNLSNQLHAVRCAVYHPHVKMEFDQNRLLDLYRNRKGLPEGYTLQTGVEGVDLAMWAGLLNLDDGFGNWTPLKIRTEIVDRLIAPDAATILFHHSRLIGCCVGIDASTGQKRIMTGRWLFLHPDYRGRSRLADELILCTAYLGVRERVDRIDCFTDPDRYAAIYLFLKNGARPRYDSLFSFVHWARIRRRMGRMYTRTTGGGKTVTGG